MKYLSLNVKLVALSLLSILLSQSCSSSKTAAAAPEQVMAKTANEKSLLWKIEGNGLTAPSYLYGTIHIIPAADYFLPEGAITAMDQSKEVMFELDMNEMSDMSKLMPLMQQAFMKDDKTLKDFVSDEDYKLIKDHFAEMGLPLFFLEKIKPMFLTVFASADFDPTDLQSGAVKSYEFEFTTMANNAKKPVSGLETIAFQISIFDDIPYEDQAAMLVEAIKSSAVGDDSFNEMVNIYKAQDIDAMYRMMQGDEQIAEHEDALLTKRNQNWIPIMSKKMAETPTFFAVGAGHLGGPNGVIALLRNKGYQVTAYRG